MAFVTVTIRALYEYVSGVLVVLVIRVDTCPMPYIHVHVDCPC